MMKVCRRRLQDICSCDKYNKPNLRLNYTLTLDKCDEIKHKAVVAGASMITSRRKLETWESNITMIMIEKNKTYFALLKR